ncbi:MAG TPA: phage protease [Tahibacter sp.]|uniref:phage protease n=1 Tax=Tahibacter sp. TaxID=2056211 RepID=UPI002C888B42|nr:phage protease [Tahibacter sp.]HSX60260.1 phage protease [Tahibacter sp.]
MHGAPSAHSHLKSLAICSSIAAGAVALAACSFEITEHSGDTIEIQVTPAGEFRPIDGREMKVPAWRINAALAARVIDRFRARRVPPVIDYEHQTLRKEQNGQPAPAAGWFRGLSWREGKGLYGTVELTQRARDHIRAKEYRYFSPVFSYDEQTGDVLDLVFGALTNDPALDNLEPLAVLAAARLGTYSENLMNPLLAALCAALGLTASSTTEAQAVAACAAIKPKFDELDQLRNALGIGEGVGAGDAVAACTALKARADESNSLRRAIGIAESVASTDAIAACTAIKTKADVASGADPAKYVPVAAVEELRTQIAALTSESRNGKVAALVETGLADGRLLPALKDWATDLGKKDFAALTAYLDKAQPIAALTSTQTRGVSPIATGENAHGLTVDQLAICTNCGITPEAFAKSLKATNRA